MRSSLIKISTIFAITFNSGSAIGQAQQYTLAPGDKITITVFGQKDLSGDFLIDGAGNIQVPLAGTLPAASATLEECKKRVEERLQEGFVKNPAVSVRIAELRPIYVFGDVKTSGAYPFRPGLTISAAVALAGGLAPLETQPGSALTELLSAEERVQSLAATRNALTIRIARLDAELANKKSFVPPKINPQTADIKALIDKEQLQLSTAVAAYEESTKLLQLQKPKIDNQIQSNKEEIAADKRQLQVNNTFVKEYDKLSSSGHGMTTTQLELRRYEGQVQADIHHLQSEISRLEITRGDLDIRSQEAERGRQTRILTEMHDSRARLEDAEISLPMARQILELRRTQAGVGSKTKSFGADYQVNITRRNTDGQVQTVSVDENEAIRPGDVVEVRRQIPKANLVELTTTHR